MPKKALVIGAGISGLATANILAKAGYKVEVVEKNKEIGGRAGRLVKDGFTFDTGPSWYLMPEVFEHYFNLFDVSAEKELQIKKLSPSYKVFFEKDKPITITSNLQKDSKTFESIEKGSGQKLIKYVENSKLIYDLSIKHFLYTNFKSISDLLKKEILSNTKKLLPLALTSVDNYVSKYFVDHRIKKILEYSMVFLGSSPYQTPAIYSLMSALDFSHGVYYPKNGIYSIMELIQKIGNDIGVKYRFNSPVQKIIVKNSVATGVQLASGKTIKADLVVSSSDIHHTETKLLSQKYQTYPSKYWKNKNPGPSAFLMYLGIKGKLPEIEHHSLLFVDKWKENFESIYKYNQIPKDASIYLSKTSGSDDKVAPKNHEALVVLVPWPSGIKVSKQTLEKYYDIYLDRVQAITGIEDLKQRVISKTLVGPDDFKSNYNSWQSNALGPAHTLSQSAIFRTKNKSKKVNNLYYAGGSTIPGIGLPMCLISSQLIYKHLSGDKKSGPVKKIEKLV